ncbi:MAG: SDR family oxidoreductase [Rhizobiales bacterium]|nr:SDR family oxidoreductase [Hyphomicrobiales bacterium]MBI3674978.1 SDR family oxidoreductase [Hyphomicrobiales bacterium]
MRFSGKRAVVTGGISGIGAAVAKRIAAEGGKVAVWDTNGGIVTDISDYASVERAVAETVRQLGGIDILVNSAGITGPTVPLAEFPIDGWNRVFAINVNGTFFTNRAVLPHMLAQNYGRIVNIASIAGKEGNPNASAYSASKAAVIGLTKSLAKELAKSNITVNAVTPAAVKTAIFDQMPQSHIDFMLSKIPKGRFGTVDEVASLVCWLASEECSFSTGAVFDISGGRATY